MQVVFREPLAAAEERELDDEADAARPRRRAARRGRRSPPPSRRSRARRRGSDARAVRDQIGMELERVRAVLELVRRAHGLRRQLARPPRGHEPAADLAGDRGAEDEAARLGAEDQIGLLLAGPASPSSAIVWSSACGSASSGVTSLKPTPGWGQSGTSRIFSFRSTALSLRGCADRARTGVATGPARARRAPAGRACPAAAAPGCASAAPARSRPRAAPSRGRWTCGTCAGGVARCRSRRAGRRSHAISASVSL